MVFVSSSVLMYDAPALTLKHKLNGYCRTSCF